MANRSARSKKPRRTLRAVLTAILIIGTIVVAVGLTVGYFVYHNYTEPDRSSPTVVIREYVDSVFTYRDPTRADRYICRNPQLAELNSMLQEITQREKDFGKSMSVTVTNMQPSVDGGTAVVIGDLRVTTDVSRSFRKWEFTLRDEQGWRVCGARRIG